MYSFIYLFEFILNLLNRAIYLYIHLVFIYILVYSFVVYSKTSVAQITQRLIVGLANNEPERIEKGAVVA